jgi:uncharacterized protein
MAKPVGPTCDSACRYCYYLKKQELYPAGANLKMPPDVLDRYIAQRIETASPDRADFVWHGGEPTLCGLDFFRDVVTLQHRHARAGQRVANNIQTNGRALDENWCRFLAAEGFTVGLSLAGPREVHDRYRVTRGGHPTHREAVQAFRLLRRHRVHCDVLCVVHDRNVSQPGSVYRFFKELQVRYLQFLPLVEPDAGSESGVSSRTPPAEAYGDFLCAIFDEWIRRDVGRMVMQFIDEAFRPLVGAEHALCHFRPTCGDQLAVEHNGDVYACDHFVDPCHRLGTILDTPLAELAAGASQRRFGEAKRDALPAVCRRCDVLSLCNGGCPKDRILLSPDQEPGWNYLCPAFKRFFAHSRTWLRELALIYRCGRALETVMPMVAAADRRVEVTVGPNRPCPCGSGGKFKNCCGRAPAR